MGRSLGTQKKVSLVRSDACFPPIATLRYLRARSEVDLALDPCDMSHLAAGGGFPLAVDVDVGAALGDEIGPALDVRSDEIFHDGAAAHEPGEAGRKIADRADMLLELRGNRALDRPVAA